MTAAHPTQRDDETDEQFAARVRRNEQQRERYARLGKLKQPASTNGDGPSAMKVTHAIGRYLDSLRVRDEHGRKPRSGGISLGALPGFPQWTDDPDVIDSARAVFEERARTETSAIRELELRQRIRDLRAAAARLRSDDQPSADRQVFVEHGARWAAARPFPISYETFREMGVPADVLRDAQISRRSVTD